jgi:CubicO group peptidase (beta-lactamase class C family)
LRNSCVIFSLVGASAFAQTVASPARLDEQVRAYADAGRFDGVVLVVRNGQPLLDKGYGLANAEWKTPNTPDTKFRLGSITKQFTAMCVLLMEQQGKWKTSDPVSKYMPDAPAAWTDITLHHLLTHTSGIPNFTGFPDYESTMMLYSPPEKTILRFRDKNLDFAPGTKHKYSNSGYVLLGFLIEKVSGMKYEDFLRQNVLGPLDMQNTGYDHFETALDRRASGYDRGQKLRHASFIDMSVPHAAGALYSTTGDLRKWDEALSAGKLLTPGNMQRYFTPFLDNYAYGWQVKEEDSRTVISHGGGINGFATMIIRIPSEKLLVVTLSNVLPSEGGKLAHELVKLSLGGDAPKPVFRTEVELTPGDLEPLVGDYQLAPNFVLSVTRDGNQLMSQATGQDQVPIFAESKTEFFLKVVDAQLTFRKDPSGKVTGLVLHQNGRDMPAPKIK